jgi:hypothetical protein
MYYRVRNFNVTLVLYQTVEEPQMFQCVQTTNAYEEYGLLGLPTLQNIMVAKPVMVSAEL